VAIVARFISLFADLMLQIRPTFSHYELRRNSLPLIYRDMSSVNRLQYVSRLLIYRTFYIFQTLDL